VRVVLVVQIVGCVDGVQKHGVSLVGTRHDFMLVLASLGLFIERSPPKGAGWR